MSKRRRRSRKSKRRNIIANIKLYSAIFGGCFAVAGILSVATGKLPGMFNNALQNAVSSSIEAKMGSLGGAGGAGGAASIINNVLNESRTTDNSRSINVNKGGGGGGGLGGAEASKVRALMQKHADKL